MWGRGPGRRLSHPAGSDRVAADHPVFLRRKCGHVGWANSRALALAGITADTPDPYGGAIERDPLTGQPTGILKELAMDLMFRLFQEPTSEEAAAAIRAAMSHAHQAGLVGVHTMEGAGAFRAFQQLQAAGDLKLRVLMQIPEDNLDAAIQAGLCSGFGNDWLRIGGVKLFSDGALGARTAHMLEPFEGEPTNYGIPVASSDHLREVIGKASRAGIASFVHAIGDAANRVVLDAIEASRRAGEGTAAPPPHRARPDRSSDRCAALRGAGRHRVDAAYPRHAGHAGGRCAVGQAQRPRLCLAQPAGCGRGRGVWLRLAGRGFGRDEGHPRRGHAAPARRLAWPGRLVR